MGKQNINSENTFSIFRQTSRAHRMNMRKFAKSVATEPIITISVLQSLPIIKKKTENFNPINFIMSCSTLQSCLFRSFFILLNLERTSFVACLARHNFAVIKSKERTRKTTIIYDSNDLVQASQHFYIGINRVVYCISRLRQIESASTSASIYRSNVCLCLP